MKLHEQGRFLELPLRGLGLKKIIFTGCVTLVFTDEEESFLDITTAFTVTLYAQTTTLSPADQASWVLFHEHFSQTIHEATADRQGNLWLTFANGTVITVEDGPYENWHYTKRNLSNPRDCLQVHGGIGHTYY